MYVAGLVASECRTYDHHVMNSGVGVRGRTMSSRELPVQKGQA